MVACTSFFVTMMADTRTVLYAQTENLKEKGDKLESSS